MSIHLSTMHSILDWLQNDFQNNLRIWSYMPHTHFKIKIALSLIFGQNASGMSYLWLVSILPLAKPLEASEQSCQKCTSHRSMFCNMVRQSELSESLNMVSFLKAATMPGLNNLYTLAPPPFCMLPPRKPQSSHRHFEHSRTWSL